MMKNETLDEENVRCSSKTLRSANGHIICEIVEEEMF
jgi:hypothetical protein